MLYGGNSLAPAINKARDAGPTGLERFEQLHRRAVGLNVLVMVVGLSLLVGFAIRPAPRTSGIIEMTPAERVRYDAAMNRLIRDVEAKYGMRPPRVPEPGETDVPEPLMDLATVKERSSRTMPRQTPAGQERAGHRRVALTGVPPRHPDPDRTAAVPTTRQPGPPASSGEP